MFPKPKSVLLPNTYAFESEPMVKSTGFRESASLDGFPPSLYTSARLRRTQERRRGVRNY